MATVGYFVEYGTTTIHFSVEYCNRKTLGIVVTPDCSVLVKSPCDATIEQINEKVRKRAAWIVRQQRQFRSYGVATPERHYINGETHLYLGRQYMLRVVVEQATERVVCRANVLEVHCREKQKAKSVLQNWYKVRASAKLMEYFQPIVYRFKKYGVQPSSVFIRDMKNRWGSCTPQGKIILNTSLIRAPRICIEYVIIHELCHLVYKNHTKDFYSLLATEMPSWEKWKVKLERFMM